MEKGETAKFNFRNFTIDRSVFIKKDGEPSDFSIELDPEGFINKENSCFKLKLKIRVHDENNIINIEVDTTGNFIFDRELEIHHLNQYFYVNAPAILFPYIRAYISTLSTLSGYKPIILPTLNLTSIGKILEKNTLETKGC
jgi:preprotein translocase subunit SecB